MIQSMESIEQVREFFAGDRFACGCLGARVDSFDFETYEARVSVDIEERHLNGHDIVMGGVYFTLADFALAVSSNANQEPATSICNSINFMKSCRGSRLTAIARPDRSGRRFGFYTVDVFDDLDNHCARMTATVAKIESRPATK